MRNRERPSRVFKEVKESLWSSLVASLQSLRIPRRQQGLCFLLLRRDLLQTFVIRVPTTSDWRRAARNIRAPTITPQQTVVPAMRRHAEIDTASYIGGYFSEGINQKTCPKGRVLSGFRYCRLRFLKAKGILKTSFANSSFPADRSWSLSRHAVRSWRRKKRQR